MPLTSNKAKKKLLDFYPLQQTEFIAHLQVLGFSLIAVSILYLIAANWLMLPKFVQLAIPLCFLFMSSLASIFVSQNSRLTQTFDAISGLMLGLSLAVIGQVYQTGADSYQLFLVWSVLLLPWLYRPNIAVFILFAVVSHLALMLFFEQTFWLDQHFSLFLCSVNLWTAILLICCLRYYPSLRYVFLAWIALFSMACMINYMLAKQLVAFFSSLLLPLLILGYFYLKKEALIVSISTLILGISLTIWVVGSILEHNSNDIIGTLFFCAILVLGWFAALTVGLKRFFPDSRFSIIPLALGAWLSGILLASSLLIAWEEASLIFAFIAIVVALIGLKSAQQLFSRQFFYCLLFCGQVAFLGHLLIFAENELAMFITQFILVIILIFWKLHWFSFAIQLAALYLVGIFAINEFYSTDYFSQSKTWAWLILSFSFYTLMLVIHYVKSKAYVRSVLLTVLGILAFSTHYQPSLDLLDPQLDTLLFRMAPYLFASIWSIAFFFMVIRPQSTLKIQIAYLVFATLLIGCQFFEILPLFMILAWSLNQQDKLIQGLSIVSIVALLWLLYYSLDISFLAKSATLLCSGIALLGLVYFLQQAQQKLASQHGEKP